MIISDIDVNGQAFTNPECLRDCFSDTSGTKRRQRGKRRKQRGKRKRQSSEAEDDSSCFAALIQDVISKETCDNGQNPAAALSTPELNIWGFNDLDNDCEMDEIDTGSGSGSGDYRDYGTGTGSAIEDY